MSQTHGERLVRVDFNVTGSNLVHQLKTKTAELINIVNELQDDRRLVALAITAYEEAAMWAVKAATAAPAKPPSPP